MKVKGGSSRHGVVAEPTRDRVRLDNPGKQMTRFKKYLKITIFDKAYIYEILCICREYIKISFEAIRIL